MSATCPRGYFDELKCRRPVVEHRTAPAVRGARAGGFGDLGDIGAVRGGICRWRDVGLTGRSFDRKGTAAATGGIILTASTVARTTSASTAGRRTTGRATRGR